MPDDQNPRRSRSLTANTIAQSSPLFIGYTASFVSAPIVLSALGLRNFGIWALTGALAAYAGLLDFGVGPSLSRFVALYDAEDREDLIGQVMTAGLLTSIGIGAALTGAAFFASGPLARHLGHISQPAMLALLLSSACMFICSLLFNALTAYQTGLRQMVAPNVLGSIGAIINFSFSVGSALISGKLVVYAMSNAAASVLLLLLTVIYMTRFAPLRAPYGRPSRAMVKHLMSFSLKNQMQTAASLINIQSDKIIIAIFIGPAAAGAYELANRVAAAAKSIGVYAVSAMVPTLTAELRHQSIDGIALIYRRLTEKTTAISVPVLTFVAALAPTILLAWLGHVPRHGAVVLAALCVGYVINTTTGVGFSVAYAKGYPGIPAQAAAIMAVANVILTVSLAPIFGLWGVLTGTVLAFSGGAFLQVVLLHRRLDMPLSLYREATMPTYIRCVVLAVPLVSAALLVDGSARWVQAVTVLVAGVAFAVVYLWLAGRSRSLPDAIIRRLPLLPDARQPEPSRL